MSTPANTKSVQSLSLLERAQLYAPFAARVAQPAITAIIAARLGAILMIAHLSIEFVSSWMVIEAMVWTALLVLAVVLSAKGAK